MHTGSAHVGGISLWKGVLFLTFFCPAKGLAPNPCGVSSCPGGQWVRLFHVAAIDCSSSPVNLILLALLGGNMKS